jgi:hypothetical protein
MNTKEQIRKEMYCNIRGYNKYLTREHLETFSIKELLANCHPEDRIDFIRKLERK